MKKSSSLPDHSAQELTCDILVAGGGPAGLSCAIAAARAGAHVILCQDRPVLGGNASSEVRMHILGADGILAARSRELEVESREGGLIEEIRLDTCVHNPQRSSSMLDLLLYDKCRTEPNLSLMLNTTVSGVTVENGRITSATADRPSTEERFLIRAQIFVDCTGDGRLGFEAGAHHTMGREGKDQFEETLAQDESDAKTLGSTILFTAKKHDQPMPFSAPTWARKFDEHDLRLRPHASPGFEYGLEYGYWWVEWGGELDTIRQNETIRDELLAIVFGVWDHIKNSGDHGAENWALDWFGFLPGKRESRRFIGEVVLSERDILESTAWPDAIAYGGWPIDTHPPGGVDAIDEPPCVQLDVPHLYDIPLRACLSRNISNLMFAGRNISATHIAFASTRVMATCSVIGQGVGAAAAFAVANHLSPSALAADSSAINTVQQNLLAQDCFLIGLRNEDQLDLARQAEVTSSSFQVDAPPESVIDGVTRSVHGPGGVTHGRCIPGLHRWISADELPAWLQLEWPEPIPIERIQLILDTGLHQLLTFSLANGVHAKMNWGTPPPDTLRDYRIDRWTGQDWEEIVKVSGNHQRRVVHQLAAPLTTKKLRITALATNGATSARIVEVRVY